MRRLEELARAAVGFDAKRGDEVAMENVSFSSNAPEMKPPVMDRVMEEARALLHSQPGLMRTAMIGLCGVLLVLFVLRPVAKQVTATLREPALLTAGTSAVAVLEEPVGEPLLEPEKIALPVRVKSKAQLEQQGIFEYVSEHIRREPAQSTRLLEAWIGSHEEKN
jgi:flagellar M-ring protein FliF